MSSCAVESCKNKTSITGNMSYFRFPADPLRCEQWIKNCKTFHLLGQNPANLQKSYRVCAVHFEDKMFLRSKSMIRLAPDAVPTIFSEKKGKQTFETVETKKNVATTSRSSSSRSLQSPSYNEGVSTDRFITDNVSGCSSTSNDLQMFNKCPTKQHNKALKRMVRTIEKQRQLLEELGAVFPRDESPWTVEWAENVSLDEIRRDKVMWIIYRRGWMDHVQTIPTAGPPDPVTNQQATPGSVGQPLSAFSPAQKSTKRKATTPTQHLAFSPVPKSAKQKATTPTQRLAFSPTQESAKQKATPPTQRLVFSPTQKSAKQKATISTQGLAFSAAREFAKQKATTPTQRLAQKLSKQPAKNRSHKSSKR